MIRIPRTKRGLALYIATVGLTTFSLFAVNTVDSTRKIARAPEKEIKTTVLGATTTETVRVTRIIDGDTFEIEGGETVRMIGIDAPEIQSKQCYSAESKLFLEERLNQSYVKLISDVSDVDQYGRLLRYVYLGDIFMNEEIVKQGYAQAKSYIPDITKQPTLAKAQIDSKFTQSGIWGNCK